MDIDFIDPSFDTKQILPREVEEAFEDPFSVRFLPDNDREDGESRYYALGRTIGGRDLFFCFTTDGKKARIIAAREMSENESAFYSRKYAEFK